MLVDSFYRSVNDCNTCLLSPNHADCCVCIIFASAWRALGAIRLQPSLPGFLRKLLDSSSSDRIFRGSDDAMRLQKALLWCPEFSHKCVCVTLCSKEFLFCSNRRGPGRMHRRLVNEAGDASEDMEMGRHFHVPAQTFVYAVTPLFPFLFPWCVSCYFPPNRFPSAASLPQMRETPLLPLSHSFLRGTDVTANPISKCVPLCRPTWAHSVIPRKGALLSLRITV